MRNGKQHHWILPVLGTLCFLSVAALIAAAVLKSGETEPDAFVPPPFEEAAAAGTPEVPETLGYSPVQAKDAFTAYVCGKVVYRDGAADVYFTSDAANSVWLKLRVLDENGSILGETGLLKPGEYVRRIKLSGTGNGADVKLKIMAYEPGTYYSAGAAVLNTTITAEGKE